MIAPPENSARPASEMTALAQLASSLAPEIFPHIFATKPGGRSGGLGMICMSGHGCEIMAGSAAFPGGCHFIPKPCCPAALARAEHAIIDQKIPSPPSPTP